MINVNGIIARYNEAFGYTAMKVAPRIIKATGLGVKNALMSNIPVYEEGKTGIDDKTRHAHMTFESTLDKDVRFAFGIPARESGHRALPFQKPRESSPNNFIAPPPMVSFNRGKNVVRTAIDRSDYEVVEYYGMKPYEITLQGILIDTEEHLYPQELVQTVNDLFAAPGTFRVISTIFNDLGIDEIFFDSGFQVNFVEGYVDTVKYRVRAISVANAEYLLQGY
ncbi:MAG: hypothetical protein JEZ14_14980 [Marinilabiliaceae bacterium]|nr:hypothetical protein [Marinilabiliaceae bacterium]